MITAAAIALSFLTGGQGKIGEWGATFVEKLASTGILTAGVRDDAFRTGHPTRYEIALAGYHAYVSLKDELPKIAAGERPARLKEWWQEVDGVVDCFRELRPELRSMGVFDRKRPDEYVAALLKMQSKLALLVAGGTHIPPWALKAKDTLMRNGMLVGYPDGLIYHPRPATRFDLAVAVHATYMHLKNIVEDVRTQHPDPTNIEAVRALSGDIQGMKGWADDTVILAKMFVEFRPELTAMEVYQTTTPEAIRADLAKMSRQIVALTKEKGPFEDVSADHWAAGALRDLKADCLIRGYADGKFRGR